MAKKAEEYGSHDKTFQIPTAGKVSVKTLFIIAISVENITITVFTFTPIN